MNEARDIITEELSQIQADTLIKGLPEHGLDNFREAFHGEKEKIGIQEIWTLPKSARIYFLARLNGAPYLLVGIHPDPLPSSPHILNVSSLARIAPAPKGHAADCLKAIVENTLIPFCKERLKRLIVTRIHTPRGLRVFEALRSAPPKGIAKISIEVTKPDWSCTMEVADVSMPHRLAFVGPDLTAPRY